MSETMNDCWIENEIKDIQKVQLDILIEFDQICKKYDLKYQLFAGTLLGAIRHQGFIPWDDDIDVCMLRKDYEKFLEIAKDELDASFFLQTYETDPEYIMPFAKIRKNDTLFVELATSESKIHQGIYIDIFPLDNVEPEKLIGKIQYGMLYFFGRLNLTRIKMHCLNAKSPAKKLNSLLGYYFLKLIPKKTTDRMQKKIYCMFNNRETTFVNHLTNGVSKKRFAMYLRERKTFPEITFVEFEGYQFPGPSNYHEVLTRNFGDYMELPPEEKRTSHHGIIKIELDTNKI